MRDATSVAEPHTLGITIAATPENVYACVAATERWPELLPHYRRVRVLAQHGTVRVVAMAAWRDVIPYAWVEEQISDPLRPAIRFRHVRGVTRGPEVQWNFMAVPGGTRVTVEQRLSADLPIVGERFERVVAALFLNRTARKTLSGIKRFVERSHPLLRERS
jgi:ribosome-associated toxin RatA of RatAB toxin-antitoxin module